MRTRLMSPLSTLRTLVAESYQCKKFLCLTGEQGAAPASSMQVFTLLRLTRAPIVLRVVLRPQRTVWLCKAYGVIRSAFELDCSDHLPNSGSDLRTGTSSVKYAVMAHAALHVVVLLIDRDIWA